VCTCLFVSVCVCAWNAQRKGSRGDLWMTLGVYLCVCECVRVFVCVFTARRAVKSSSDDSTKVCICVCISVCERERVRVLVREYEIV